jgi:succinate dehydrogenase / fumarate reductase iron-sulfur subunit
LRTRTKKPDKIEIRLDILRRSSADDKPFWQSIYYETGEMNATVASALTDINNSGGYRDVRSEPAPYIRWECGCLQKKCGACAMLVNGTPKLACDSFLNDYRKQITIEPLRKFPIIADLIVDRAILYDNLKEMKLWSNEAFFVKEQAADVAYDASRCLQCGCCLEVCPNFCAGEMFFGAAGFVPAARLLSSLTNQERRRIKAVYMEHVYAGCGKSLACAKICPAGIDAEQMLIQSNAIAFWGRNG